MLYKQRPTQAVDLQALLEPLNYNLSLLSLLAGETRGQIYVDNPTRPTAAFIEIGHHLFLAGSAKIEDFNRGVQQLVQQVVIPRAKAAGNDIFMLHVENDTWNGPARYILEDLYPILRTRQYFECTQLRQDWRGLIQPGYNLHPVSAKLVAQSHLKHIDYLREELCSERSSVGDFLEKSFGFAILHDDDLAAWCLSEYNLPGRCEVGVATVDEYQKRGLGTVASLALVEHALTHGYGRVGWHCWKWNLPSSALALRAGFDHVRDYPVYMCILNLGVQLALHGYDSQADGDYSAALAWYQRALSTSGKPPSWAYYNTARCLARLGQPGPAIDFLHQAFEHGFDGFDAARSEPDLESLRKSPGWDTIIPAQ